MSTRKSNVALFPLQGSSTTLTSNKRRPWRVLIADDDREIHTVTKLALSGVLIEGRSLEFLNAYSAEEAIEILRNEDDIAVLLLDVVMESEDAGLRAVKSIREELKNEHIRIVLRTGQPGYAPEEKVITDYDINDYTMKNELTRNKLLTTVVTALRSYRQICTIEQNRQGLEKIIGAAANLMERNSLVSFSEGVVTQLASLLGMMPEGLLCVGGHTINDEDKATVVLGAAGNYAHTILQPLVNINNDKIEQVVAKCLTQKSHLFLPDAHVYYIGSKDIEAAAYLETSQLIEGFDQQMVEIFLANIAIGFENVSLFEELRAAAYRDTLTGLPNRAEFSRLLQVSFDDDSDEIYAICDVSHFSDVNETLGQDVGNRLLNKIGMRFRAVFPEDVIVARIGADVFGLIGSRQELTPERIAGIFREPYKVEEDRIPVMMMIGLTQRHNAETGLDILKQCYLALKTAKKHKLDGYAYFHPSMEKETARRLDIVRRLRNDFRDKKLQIWYQPQVNLKELRVVGFEALLRWPQEDGSFIPPDEFIPLAEYSGLIVDIGAWVLEEACRTLHNLSELCGEQVRMAVNVSIPQFRNVDFPRQVERVLRQYHLSGERLELEITESIVMDDPTTVIEILKALRRQGVGVAIDDFGVGFSSLSYVQQLPVNKLKIDREFVQKSDTVTGAIIIETIARMGHQLGLITIAEGVETNEQLEYFRGLSVAEGQGYLFAKPLPLEELKILLKNGPYCTK